ncbi:cupin [Streptomyces spiroverticillatus]|uniref:Cupin n=1 Tax=Streptomyces finlayi TaxID=67296 RepID=A0A919CFX3_9ACTN|nr:cupin domain-containing protein [Streptomyces finlayi]GHA48609.1 cupin [Streptomyces spiroverticillatus]GHD18984.1 cupin [Streptomyces finlayi]
MTDTADPLAEARRLAALHRLQPLPVEGGLFRQTWAGEADDTGRPAGTAIMVLLTSAPGDFSALHRLPTDEVWHFYRGDPLELLLLAPDGGGQRLRLGDTDGTVQYVVEAGTWMGARVAPGGAWSLFGTTMAPGFLPTDYEGGDAKELSGQYPEHAELVRQLFRPDAPLTMTEGDDDHA